MAHDNDQGDQMDMEVETGETAEAQLPHDPTDNGFGHPHSAAPPNGLTYPPHPPPQYPTHRPPQQYTETTPTVPYSRTESGDSQRSQTRRFAAGHAEMQRSAFISTQNDQEEVRASNKSKSSPMEEAEGMDDSSMAAYYDTQRQKRPRRYTKDPKEE